MRKELTFQLLGLYWIKRLPSLGRSGRSKFAMALRQTTRTPPPRQLQANETLESLTHWRTTFKTFYKKDDIYRGFFHPKMQWDPNKNNYGLRDEVDGHKRQADELCEDLQDLLSTLAGYLPHSYLTEKIVKATKNWEDVFNVIYDHYNVKISSESMLDFEMIHKTAEETHRQFYERLLQHTRQHLAPANVKVENITNVTADTMSISLMNMVALQWLRKTNPALLKIIKTEYSTDLRSNIQLADLVPRIAPNIDSLLERYDQGNSTNKVSIENNVIEVVDTAAINKTWNQGSTKGRGRQFQRGQASEQSSFNRSEGLNGNRPQTRRGNMNYGAGPFCPGCFYLSQQLKTTVHFRYSPGNCPRRSVTVKMLQMEDEDYFTDDFIQEDLESGGKKINLRTKQDSDFQYFQTTNEKVPHYVNSCSRKIELNSCNEVSFTDKENIKICSTFSSPNDSLHVLSDVKKMAYDERLSTQIRKLEARKSIWANAGIRKAKSPCILATLGPVPVYVTIDEGSEVNCMDESFAMKNAITFVPTTCRATAAGCSTMVLAGQTKDNIVLNITHNKRVATVHVGKMIIVKNLGVEILLGEPGKVDNSIVTIPHLKLVEFSDLHGKRMLVPYSFTLEDKTIKEPDVFRCKASKNEVVYEGQSVQIQLPVYMRKEKRVALANKNVNLYPGIRSQVLNVNNGVVLIKNEDTKPLKLSKHEHFQTLICFRKYRMWNKLEM